jgi:ABC-type nitrate/sulfonate/bicarbonate transport system permease component
VVARAGAGVNAGASSVASPRAPGRRADAAAPLLYGAGAMLAILVAWTAITTIPGIVPARILPTPLEVVVRFAQLVVEPFSGSTLAGHAVASLERWLLGVAVALAVGIPMGIVLAWLPPLRAAITPIFELLRYIPPFAWVPIAVLWLGATTVSQALIVFIAAFPACVINTQLGVGQVDRILLLAARALGAPASTTLRRVVLPVAAPSIFTGIRIAFSNGWMALVGAELIVGKQGLGYLISQGQQNDSVATIVVGMATIGAIGALIDVVLQRLQRGLLPWKSVNVRPA